MKRRSFIRQSMLASASAFLPAFLKQSPLLAGTGSDPERILVVIQLSGGNDGLNTVVPYRNDLYYKSRPTLAISPGSVARINDDYGFNPALEAMRDLFDDGELGVLQGVGYPNPDRSHFRALDIWHSASPSSEYWNTGWIGRYLDAHCSDCNKPHLAIEADDSLSLVMKGERTNGLALSNPSALKKALSGTLTDSLASRVNQTVNHPLNHYLYKTLADAHESADYLFRMSKLYRAGSGFPNSGLGRDLKMIAELILGGSETRIYYVSLSGFDTHNNQKVQQERLLREYAEALSAFRNEMKLNQAWNRVKVLTFSEFGRRVNQNASNGTDHGKANCVFIAGGKLNKPGLFNALPSLENLDDGDLRFEIDFRSVYAGLLEHHLQVNAAQVLSGSFKSIHI